MTPPFGEVGRYHSVFYEHTLASPRSKIQMEIALALDTPASRARTVERAHEGVLHVLKKCRTLAESRRCSTDVSRRVYDQGRRGAASFCESSIWSFRPTNLGGGGIRRVGIRRRISPRQSSTLAFVGRSYPKTMPVTHPLAEGATATHLSMVSREKSFCVSVCKCKAYMLNVRAWCDETVAAY